MNELLQQIGNCTDRDKKFHLVIKYMETEGVAFTVAQSDHLKNRYRILEDGSSIFVLASGYKMNLCNADKLRLEKNFHLQFAPLYKNKAQQIRDTVRPWTCKFEGEQMLEEVTLCLVGKELEAIVDINVPRKPKGYGEDGTVICPKCEYAFEKAERCPDCGQLIDYSL